MHEEAYNNNLTKIKHASGKLGQIREKIAKYDAELKMSRAEAEMAKLAQRLQLRRHDRLRPDRAGDPGQDRPEPGQGPRGRRPVRAKGSSTSSASRRWKQAMADQALQRLRDRRWAWSRRRRPRSSRREGAGAGGRRRTEAARDQPRVARIRESRTMPRSDEPGRVQHDGQSIVLSVLFVVPFPSSHDVEPVVGAPDRRAAGARLRALPDWYPAWARELAELYFSGTTCLFVLHGNVHDLIRCPRRRQDDATATCRSSWPRRCSARGTSCCTTTWAAACGRWPAATPSGCKRWCST